MCLPGTRVYRLGCIPELVLLVADMLVEEVNEAAIVEGVKSANVELTFEPPWDKSMMSEEARLELGFF